MLRQEKNLSNQKIPDVFGGVDSLAVEWIVMQVDERRTVALYNAAGLLLGRFTDVFSNEVKTQDRVANGGCRIQEHLFGFRMSDLGAIEAFAAVGYADFFAQGNSFIWR